METEDQNLEERVSKFLKLNLTQMSLEIKKNTPIGMGAICNEHSRFSHLKLWDSDKDAMFNRMSVYEVAYRLRYPLKLVKWRAKLLGIPKEAQLLNVFVKTEAGARVQIEKSAMAKEAKSQAALRDIAILKAVASGESVSSVAKRYQITRSRVAQIVKRAQLENTST